MENSSLRERFFESSCVRESIPRVICHEVAATLKRHARLLVQKTKLTPTTTSKNIEMKFLRFSSTICHHFDRSAQHLYGHEKQCFPRDFVLSSTIGHEMALHSPSVNTDQRKSRRIN